MSNASLRVYCAVVHIIAPIYPLVAKMADLADGIAGILESEQIQKANFSGCHYEDGWLNALSVGIRIK